MTLEWHFRRLSVTNEHGALSDIESRFCEERVCLLGHWEPLFCLLTGRAHARSGEVLFEGKPAREAVIAGHLGVADPKLRLPSEATVHTWLVDNLLLLGNSKRSASAQAELSLDALQLRYLKGRAGRSLSPAETYAARLALAISTDPRAVLVEAPTTAAQTASFQLALLRRVAERAQLVMTSDWFTDAGAIGWSQRVLSLNQGKLTSNCPTDRWLRERSYYCLVAESNQAQLEQELVSAGVEVHNAGQRELLVSLPQGRSTRLLVSAAHRAQSPLSRMLPIDGQTAPTPADAR